jgi:beta-lactamase class A
MRILPLTVMGCAAAAVGCGDPPAAPFTQRVTERVAAVPGATVGVLLKVVGDSAVHALHADTVFHAASTMKVPVMIEYFRQRDAGTLPASHQVRLQNRFRSIVDGSPYALEASEDSDSVAYSRLGQEVAVRDLVEWMIVRSSNLATNAVIDLLGAERIQETARALGAATIAVRRGVEDDKAYAQGLNNTTTARDLAALMEAIASRRAASPASCEEMLAILGRQEFNSEIPAGLPPGTRVAHKTGEITGVLHDAAIVVPPAGRDPFVLVVLTSGIADRAQARALIQDVARYAWETVLSGP